MPPRFVVTEVLDQMRGFVGKPADQNILYTSFAEKLAKVASLSEADRQALLARAKQAIQTQFDALPREKPIVAAVPEFKAATAPGAYYQAPALDASRPGTFFANVWDPGRTPRWAMPTLADHEGIPGHHLQLSVQAQMTNVPTFRKVLPFAAYGEGWALYAERFAHEAGFETDAADNLGRLQAELFRATRLVVDTGLHYKRWSRQQAVDYMLATTGMPRADVETEIERYIVWPGQACAYKVGMAKILELRDLAR